MADVNGVLETFPDGLDFSDDVLSSPIEETFPDGLDFGVEPLTNPIEETSDDLSPHGLLLFNISPTPGGGGLVRVNPKLIRTTP